MESAVHSLEARGLLAKFESPAGQAQLAVKRALDVVFSAVGLLLLSPVLLLLALAVAADSRGPILYRWEVVGKGGRPFTGYKFRTMVQDADRRKGELMEANEMSGPVFKMREDPRVTRLGRFMRSHSLDELPQLWSVLVGHMSLVGPRPPLKTEWDRFTPHQRLKLSVTPGITCLWQVEGRSGISDFDEWVRLDLEYIRNWSLWLDVKILLRTVLVVTSGQGAY
ncbi:MAG TPA: sugar transferase [Longimicrobiales bacterium]|nr:sugar transferase [Longimicrobiales bacterium]